ncbi:MAG: EamA family transporter, partial [Oligoflexia bacterium]|nr:EamA family transporter [Oligoflexia bacterium]
MMVASSLISALMSAFCAVLEKKMLFSGDVFEFSFGVSVCNLLYTIPLAFIYMLYNDVTIFTSSIQLLLIAKVILGAFAFLCVMGSIKQLQLSASLPLLLLTPAFVAVFSFAIFGTRLSKYQVSG